MVMIACHSIDNPIHAEGANNIVPWDSQSEGVYFLAEPDKHSRREHKRWDLVKAGSNEVVKEAWSNTSRFDPVEGTDEWVLDRGDMNVGGLPGDNVGFKACTYGFAKPIRIINHLLELKKYNDASHVRRVPEGYWVNSDRRRLVFIREGDIWRAEYDWAKGEVINEKQITRLGVFKDKEPFLWSGNSVFILGDFDKDKPVVRIELDSGVLTEINWFHLFPPGKINRGLTPFITNPSQTTAIAAVEDWLQLVDLNDGRSIVALKNIPIVERFNIGNNRYENHQYLKPKDFVENAVWIDDSRAIAITRYGYMELDIKTGELTGRHWEGIFGDDKVEITSASLVRLFPDTSEAILGIRWEYPETRSDSQYTLCHFNLKTKQFTKLNIESEVAERVWRYDWVDANHCVWMKRDGGLSQIGLWVYERNSDMSRRMGGAFSDPMPQAIIDNAIYIMEDRKERNGSSTRTVRDTYMIDLEGGSIDKISSGWRSIYVLPKERVDIGYGSDSTKLWKQSSPQSQLVKEQPAGALQGLVYVLNATKGEDRLVQTIAVKAYEEAMSKNMSEYYSAEKVAVLVVQHYKKKVEEKEGGLNNDLSHAVDEAWASVDLSSAFIDDRARDSVSRILKPVLKRHKRPVLSDAEKERVVNQVAERAVKVLEGEDGHLQFENSYRFSRYKLMAWMREEIDAIFSERDQQRIEQQNLRQSNEAKDIEDPARAAKEQIQEKAAKKILREIFR